MGWLEDLQRIKNMGSTKGTIVSHNVDGAFVDVGMNFNGFIPTPIHTPLTVGAKLDVFPDRIDKEHYKFIFDRTDSKLDPDSMLLTTEIPKFDRRAVINNVRDDEFRF